MLSLEEFIEKTNAAQDAEEIFTLFRTVLHDLGFDRIVYSLLTDHPSLGQKAGHGIMHNYPDEWMTHYAEKNYQAVDPVPGFAFKTSRPFTWDWLIQTQPLTPDEDKVMAEAREAGLLDGVGVPIYGPNGEVAGVSVASSSGGIRPDKNMLCRVRAYAMQFHLAFSEKEYQEPPLRQITLSPREQEVLLWAAEGKGDSEIADILHISYDTVRFHFKNIFEKLHANSRHYAVIKALRHGLISPAFIGTPYRDQ